MDILKPISQHCINRYMQLSITFSVTVSDKDSKGTILQTPWNVLENFCLKAHGGCAKHCRSDPYKSVMGKRNWALLVIPSGFSLADDSGSLPFFSHPSTYSFQCFLFQQIMTTNKTSTQSALTLVSLRVCFWNHSCCQELYQCAQLGKQTTLYFK